MFAVSFDEIAPSVSRAPAATRQLASRARRRVQGAAPAPDPDLERQRAVVDAFLAASREGDFDALVAVLDPDVVLHADTGALQTPAAREVRGAAAVARQALLFRNPAVFSKPALVNGAAGIVTTLEGKPSSILGFTVRGGRIVGIDILADPERLREVDLAALED